MPLTPLFVFQCAICRRVRADGAVWADGSPPAAARVSHGLCPRCLAAHYPEVRLTVAEADRSGE